MKFVQVADAYWPNSGGVSDKWINLDTVIAVDVEGTVIIVTFISGERLRSPGTTKDLEVLMEQWTTL